MAKRTMREERSEGLDSDRIIDPDEIKRPAFALFERYASYDGSPHRHVLGQLVYVSEGVLRVETETGMWVVLPQRGVWVPPGLMHRGLSPRGFAVRLLTVSASNAHVRSAGANVAVDRVTIALWWVVIGCVVAAIVLELGATDPAWWLSVTALLLVLAAGICLGVLVRRRRAGHKGFRGIRS